MTTHYLEEADFLADRIGIIDEGKIVALGTALDLKTDMIDTHTIIIKAWNLTQKTIMEMKEKYEDVQITDGTMTITDKRVDLDIVDYLHMSERLFARHILRNLPLTMSLSELRKG